MRAAVYARVSTHDQQTLPLQLHALRDYVQRRGWELVSEVQDVASGASTRPLRDALLKAARQRCIDVVLVWQLDRWGRSLPDLVGTLQELDALGVAFVSLNEALDLTTPSGRALAGMLAVFAQFERDLLRDRVRAGIAQARALGRSHGRPATARAKAVRVHQLAAAGNTPAAIAKRLGIGRTSVRRILQNDEKESNSAARN